MRRIRGDDGRGRGKEGGGEATRVIARLNGVLPSPAHPYRGYFLIYRRRGTGRIVKVSAKRKQAASIAH